MTKNGCVPAVALLLAVAAPALAQAPPFCVPPPSGLVAWWPGEGNANDIVGGHDGILRNGATFASGRIGRAFSFDGIDDFVEVIDEEPFDFGAGTFSVSVWVKTAAGRDFSELILSKGDLWSGGDDYALWVSGTVDGSGQVQFQWVYPSPEADLRSTSRLDDDAWHHVAVTQSGACAGCATLYVDGVLEDVRDGKSIGNSVDSFLIGATYSRGLLYSFKGAIDELAVFDRALSAEEVQSLFAAGLAGSCSTVRAWVGLKSGDDQGTRFDLGAALYVNDTLVAEGVTPCVPGISRSPAQALEVPVPLGPGSAQPLRSGDVVTLTLLTRVATNRDRNRCPSHDSAAGLRLYYDAARNPSRVGIASVGGGCTELYLDSTGGTLVLADVPPGPGPAKTKDSDTVTLAGGNHWAVIGVWSRVIP